LVLVPARNAVLGATDRAKIQVFDPGLSAVDWSIDSDNDLDLAAATLNGNYVCGAGCGVYEFDIVTTALGQGSHYFTIRASDTQGNVARLTHGFQVNNLGSNAAGDGFLLRRTRGSQLCIDCHNLATHSSQSTGDGYGNWAIGCTVCHTPHRTTNISLIRQQIETPKSGVRSVRFESTTGAVADSSAAGAASYVNEDNATQADGPCQVCHTRTKSSGGAARWRNDPAGGNADTHHTSSSTSGCTGCHTHAAGFSGAGGACNSCHFAPPAVGKHGSHDEVGSLPDDYANLIPTTTSGQYGFACAKCHSSNPNDHFPAESAPYTVDISFDATADPKNPSGAYAPDGPSQATDPGVNGDGWYWSDGSCSNLYCHSNAGPIGSGAQNSNATVTWDQAAALDCASCHDTQGRTDSTQTADLSTAHGKHIQSTSGETGSYAFTCDECHAATIRDNPNDPWNLAAADLTDKREHVDGAKDVLFSTTATPGGIDQSGGSYSEGPGYSCSGTYCHSPGNKTSGFDVPEDTALSWETGSSTCRSCHAGDATSTPTMTAGKHENHVDQAGVIGTNYECMTCHNATVSAGDNEAITNLANHVNGAKNVAGAYVDSPYVSPTCAASYCHSSGQDPAISTPPTNSEFYTTPDWFTATADALDCKGCHGRHTDPGAVVSVAGEPNYSNGGAGAEPANSHGKHVNGATDCTSCHNDTTTTGTAITNGVTIHTDGNRDVVISASWDTNGGDGADNYNSGNKTCSGIKCHGGGTPQWGGLVYCINCHGDTDDFDNWVIDDGNMSTISTSEWTNFGHGQSGGGAEDEFPLPGANPCLYCHNDGVNHDVDLNPFRLANFDQTSVDPSGDGWNSVCLVCHMTGSTGYDPGPGNKNAATKIDAYHAGTDHTSGNDGGSRCWDCHDPHGDDTNVKMVGDFLLRDGTDVYGLGGTRTAIATVFVNDPATWSDFAAVDPGPYNKVCNVCHSDGGDGCQTGNHYASNCGDGHKSGQLCTGCHIHDQPPDEAFKPQGGDCLSCHGDASGAPGRRAVQTDFAKNSHHVGASVDAAGDPLYTQPNMGGALTNFDCVVCHAEGKVIAGPDTDTTGQPHQDGIINLRNADSSTAYWSYDKDVITGTANTWMSGNSNWETETSQALDPFCLSCHDTDGALATFNNGTNEGSGFTGTATNPFADTAITNEYDRVSRGVVVNIRNRVDAYVDASNTSITPVDREGGSEPRTADGRPDPTQGTYSRHAVRGDGSFGAGSVYGTSQIPSNRWVARPAGGSWNDTSVMGCADCHTTDGANTTDGNAHGSNTEYLLKDADGLAATEPTFDLATATSSKINCYKCHTPAWYSRQSGQEHTDNNSDWVFAADQTGSASRLSGNGNLYGLPCTSCHGGAATFGTIHGTSDMFDINEGWKCSDSGDWCDPSNNRTCNRNPQFCTVQVQRQAYRFMNGANLRYYDPNGWTGSSVTCYTLSSGDSWGGCTQHSPGSGKPWTRPVQRQIKY
jgi:predicted CxxxxCH...CXXCH cytochrome family protein